MTSRCLVMYLLLGSILTINARDTGGSRATISAFKEMTDEIAMIRTNMWHDVFVRLDEIEYKMETSNWKAEQSLEQCVCANVTAHAQGEEYNKTKYDDLYASLVEERKMLRQTIEQMKKIQQHVRLFDVLNTTEGLKMAGSVDMLDRLSKSIKDIEEQNIQKKLRSFRQPSFISDWILMKAQSANDSQASVNHGLHDIPYKVEVQIRPVDGVNSDWLFHGDSAFQSDDDTHKPYGGLVYLYNDETVLLIAPSKNNHGNTGALINTGASGEYRLGSHHQISKDAYARVKVWGPADFPKPDFQTVWKPLNIKDSKLSYYEVDHGLEDYPAFVNFQMRCKTGSSFLISEGVGASVEAGAWVTSAGVVWAFNDRTVRVWTGYMHPDYNGHVNQFSYFLLGLADGWNFDNSCDNYNGEFRILAWSQNSMVPDQNFFTGSPTTVVLSETNFSPESDLLSFYVQCEEGENEGFRFKGFGNSQTLSSPFGGVVYAFNQREEFRIWRPNPEKGGFLVHVHSPYGNGINVQATNNASYVVDISKGFK